MWLRPSPLPTANSSSRPRTSTAKSPVPSTKTLPTASFSNPLAATPLPLLLVLAADHLITDQPAFAQAVAQAMRLAAQGKLVTFGIQPETPETGYGYIEADGNTVLRFVEKPSPEKAQEYVESGNYLWNSGMFCFSAVTMLREMQLHCPNILAATRA